MFLYFIVGFIYLFNIVRLWILSPAKQDGCVPAVVLSFTPFPSTFFFFSDDAFGD